MKGGTIRVVDGQLACGGRRPDNEELSPAEGEDLTMKSCHLRKGEDLTMKSCHLRKGEDLSPADGMMLTY
eukprot:954431-Lingulodinium_polyedra.AAC.1